jgi:predicted glycosyltransferase
VLFYSHDGTGLGHLRITLGVASAYAARRPQDSLLLVTGSPQAGAFEIPANLDFVKIPAMPKRDLYASLPPTEGFVGSHNSTVRFRKALLQATFEGFDPHLVVVDHAPAGLFQELTTTLQRLRQREPQPALALLMRDITFGPKQTRGIWAGEGVYPLLDETYDRILVYGDQRIFDPISAYDMSASAATRTRFCGYLAPAPPRREPARVRAELAAGDLPLIAVSVGGGADGGPILRAYLEGLRQRGSGPLVTYLVTGPLLPTDDRAAVSELAAGIEHLHIVEFDPDFVSVLRAADAVVSMGGYNSLVEAAYFGKRPVVVPRTPGPEEQILRARGFADLGLATLVEPEPLRSEMLWQAIEDALRATASPPQLLPFDGLSEIARDLAALATRG